MKKKIISICSLLQVSLFLVAKPNIIIVLTDDQGYNDLGCFGSPDISTPNIDEMAKEGLRLTDFYVSESVSSASRASLLTGRNNTKNGVKGVFFPNASEGLPESEFTMAEALKTQDYATACIGKWHLGDRPEFMPTNQGFDYFYGIPYSNDMYITPCLNFAPNVVWNEGYDLEKSKHEQQQVITLKKIPEIRKVMNNLSPLVEQLEIIEYPCDQSLLTQRYFDKAIEFIQDHTEDPFFIYLTPAMPHYPVFPSKAFKGKSKGGIYGDVVEEIDHHMGRMLKTLDDCGLEDNTIVIYLSDNGPWLGRKGQAGSAHPLRNGKFTHYEGGVRVPFIIKWPNVIEGGSKSSEISASIDLFPTLTSVAGIRTQDLIKPIDGVNVLEFWKNPEVSPRDHYLYVRNGKVFGIRKNDWVLLPKTGDRYTPKNPTPQLFNIKDDPSQKQNIYSQHPEIVQELTSLLLSSN